MNCLVIGPGAAVRDLTIADRWRLNTKGTHNKKVHKGLPISFLDGYFLADCGLPCLVQLSVGSWKTLPVEPQTTQVLRLTQVPHLAETVAFTSFGENRNVGGILMTVATPNEKYGICAASN